MKTKFNSQICTSREQSERLLALGLKKETADMIYERSAQYPYDFDLPRSIYEEEEFITRVEYDDIPAWSLHRLLSMLPSYINEFQLKSDLVYSVEYENLIGFIQGYLYDNIIDCIEWLIKEGYFNKEYLV